MIRTSVYSGSELPADIERDVMETIRNDGAVSLPPIEWYDDRIFSDKETACCFCEQRKFRRKPVAVKYHDGELLRWMVHVQYKCKKKCKAGN
jgi:hypothetical protein